MSKILWAVAFAADSDSIGTARYDTAGLAWRAVHEILEEAFGDNYGETEIATYAVVAVN